MAFGCLHSNQFLSGILLKHDRTAEYIQNLPPLAAAQAKTCLQWLFDHTYLCHHMIGLSPCSCCAASHFAYVSHLWMTCIDSSSTFLTFLPSSDRTFSTLSCTRRQSVCALAQSFSASSGMSLQADTLMTTFPLTWPASACLCASLPNNSASQCAAVPLLEGQLYLCLSSLQFSPHHLWGRPYEA